jgi:hypothetical protein
VDLVQVLEMDAVKGAGFGCRENVSFKEDKELSI